MQSYILHVISNLFFIVVVMMIIDILVPEGYKKYIDIFIGISVIVILISPFLSISKEFWLKYYKQVDEIKNEIKINDNSFKDTFKQNLIDEYKQRLISNIKENVYAKTGKRIEMVYLDIYDDFNSNNFGRITKIRIKGDYNEDIARILHNEYLVGNQNIIFEEVISSNDKR